MACDTGSLSLASSSVTASAWKRSCDLRDSPNGSPALTYFLKYASDFFGVVWVNLKLLQKKKLLKS